MLEYRVGDVRERLAEIPDGSVDLIVTSPPFLALRSYLPSDHEHKHLEIGSEATPAEFIDTLLALTAEFGRVLAPHGSICVELGDTYAGSKSQDDGVTIDYHRPNAYGSATITRTRSTHDKRGSGWPLAKSLTGIPTLYPWSLAYGRNLLTGQPSPAGMWRIRNLIVWARPNPPVGALGDKFRPATSYITIACRGVKRFFDLDAVRYTAPDQGVKNTNGVKFGEDRMAGAKFETRLNSNPAGAPPLDHNLTNPEDGDWLWKLPTQPYKGAHYATFPLELPTRLITAMCPLRVCVVCGKPSERIVGEATYVNARNGSEVSKADWADPEKLRQGAIGRDNGSLRQAETVGWSDCGHNTWRTGVVLDPFGGSGTVAQAAQNVGRHAILIDLDSRNADLARERCGMFLSIDGAAS